jgi:hypothetical protein
MKAAHFEIPTSISHSEQSTSHRGINGLNWMLKLYFSKHLRKKAIALNLL